MDGFRPLLWTALLPLVAALAACGTGGPSGSGGDFKAKGTSADGLGYYSYAPPADERGYYKVGKPYQIAGLWYHPREDFGYVETGIASWYGPDFHGQRTANGEVYDMEALTAAHRTLQLPSVARVTNLENGRSVVVRINDRGPFARDRIIDLSRRAAEMLGFHDRGTARVRVEVLPEESRMIAELAKNGADVARMEEFMARRHGQQPTGRPAVQTVAYTVPVRPASLFVQAGAFSVRENAERLQVELARFGDTRIDRIEVNGRTLYRVRLGPLGSVDAAERLLSSLTENGYALAQVVVE